VQPFLLRRLEKQIACLVGILIGLGFGIGISPLVYPPRVETRKVVFDEGPGAWDDAPVTLEAYDQIQREPLVLFLSASLVSFASSTRDHHNRQNQQEDDQQQYQPRAVLLPKAQS
jgi:hypothetical protein